MAAKKQRRPGATVTFSVSVDPETKRALRALADEQFGGSVSAVVTDMAEQARRRLAAVAYLARASVPRARPTELAEIEAELAAGARPLGSLRRRGRAA